MEKELEDPCHRAQTDPAGRPLCVDMDGTLLRTDTLQEGSLAFLRQSFWRAWLLPVWLLGGRANFKRQLARHAELAVDSLPHSSEFLDFLIEEHRRGRRLVLATGADELTARKVASRFPIFSDVIASDGHTNLKGRQKLARLVERFGEAGFDYAGNSRADLPLWRAANEAILVNVPAGLMRQVRRQARVTRAFGCRAGWLGSLARAMRLHQWAKNLLLFVPVISGHELHDAQIMQRVALGTLAFCLCAASVYVTNDLNDLEADRAHQTKRSRPFASGELPLAAGLLVAPALLALSLVCAAILPTMFVVYLGIYYLAATLYSWKLKKVVLLDVFVLAGLYTLRILAGHGASGIAYSNWLLGFSMFLFLSLALLKRYIELRRCDARNHEMVLGRGYLAEDLVIVSSFGLACGTLSALVLALYINSNEVRLLYHRPWLLMFICPLLLYWLSRAWLLGARDQLHDDPVVFALKDRTSYLVGGVIAFFVWLATGSW